MCITQIFGGGNAGTHTSMMLWVQNNQLTFYNQKVIINRLDEHWHRLNIIHDADTRDIHVYVNGTLKFSGKDNGPEPKNFKLGVYQVDQKHSSHKMELLVKNIKTFRK